MLVEETEDVIVLLPGELLAERLDVFQETLDRTREREFFFFLDPGELKSARAGFEFETLAFLRFESFGGGDAGGGAEATAVLPPLDDVAAGTGAPLDPAPRVALERHVAPAASGLH